MKSLYLIAIYGLMFILVCMCSCRTIRQGSYFTIPSPKEWHNNSQVTPVRRINGMTMFKAVGLGRGSVEYVSSGVYHYYTYNIRPNKH